MKSFKNDEAGYIAWVRAHPKGFIVSVDESDTRHDYPMVHSTMHEALSNDKRGNYTTGQFSKLCSEDLGWLEEWSRHNVGKRLRHCEFYACSSRLRDAALSDDEMEKLWS